MLAPKYVLHIIKLESDIGSVCRAADLTDQVAVFARCNPVASWQLLCDLMVPPEPDQPCLTGHPLDMHTGHLEHSQVFAEIVPIRHPKCDVLLHCGYSGVNEYCDKHGGD